MSRGLGLFKRICHERPEGQASIARFQLYMVETKWRASAQKALATAAYTSPDASLLRQAIRFSEAVTPIRRWIEAKSVDSYVEHPTELSALLQDFDDYLPQLIANFEATERLLSTSTGMDDPIDPQLSDPLLSGGSTFTTSG